MKSERPILYIHIFGYISSLLILIAGLSKSLDYSTFFNSLSEWSIIDSRVTAVTAAVTPLIELTLASLWILKVRRHAIGILIAMMLMAYTIALVWEFRVSGSVDCNCFANFLNEPESPHILWYVLRNIAIALPFLLLAILRFKSRKGSKG